MNRPSAYSARPESVGPLNERGMMGLSPCLQKNGHGKANSDCADCGHGVAQAFGVLQLVRFPTMDPQELCEAAKHPVVVGDPNAQVMPLP